MLIPSTESRAQGIFGVPLRQSITYANVAISLIDENGQSYIYGYVPIVVAKCGVFLKEKGTAKYFQYQVAMLANASTATGIEGIFRLSGSEKRIKELKTIFDSPDRYGKGLVWEGYTVHDAANVLRRYLNDLPEPVVPLDLYEKFRDPLRGATKQAVGDTEGPQFVENFDERAAIEKYQKLITELPPLNRQLLLYILDLLAVFAAKSDENRMNSQNLAAIFQPGMLSHPNHAMAPEEYRLNQCVIIFLIENQDHFLIGMQGTAADEKTVKEVESGTPSAPVTPNVNRKSGLNRSASNASAGAESVRRDGQIRRNRSVSSRNSRHDGSTTPNSPSLTATPATGGLARSNTVPSKKSPAIAGGRFQRNEGSSPNSPARLEPLTQVHSRDLADQSEKSSLGPAAVGGATLAPEPASTPGRSQERLLEVLHESSVTPTKDRSLPSIFQRSPTDNSEKRQPNKLRKKRIPGSLNPSAQSSNASLPHAPLNAVSPTFELGNPLDQPHAAETRGQHELLHPTPLAASADIPHRLGKALVEEEPEQQLQQQQHHESQHPPIAQHNSDLSSEPTPRASQIQPHHGLHHPENTLKAKMSPPTSLHSSFNEGSDIEHGIDEMSISTVDANEREKKRRWRLSRTRKDDNGIAPGLASPRMLIGSNDNADVSSTSIGSGSGKPRKSFNEDPFDPTILGHEQHGSFDSSRENRDDSKGPIGWIRNKYREAKESAEQRRAKSPPADRPLIGSALVARGPSLESEKQASHPPQGSSTATPATTAVPAVASTSSSADSTAAAPIAASNAALAAPGASQHQHAQPQPTSTSQPQACDQPQPQGQFEQVVAAEPQIQAQEQPNSKLEPALEIQAQQPEETKGEKKLAPVLEPQTEVQPTKVEDLKAEPAKE